MTSTKQGVNTKIINTLLLLVCAVLCLSFLPVAVEAFFLTLNYHYEDLNFYTYLVGFELLALLAFVVFTKDKNDRLTAFLFLLGTGVQYLFYVYVLSEFRGFWNIIQVRLLFHVPLFLFVIFGRKMIRSILFIVGFLFTSLRPQVLKALRYNFPGRYDYFLRYFVLLMCSFEVVVLVVYQALGFHFNLGMGDSLTANLASEGWPDISSYIYSIGNFLYLIPVYLCPFFLTLEFLTKKPQ